MRMKSDLQTVVETKGVRIVGMGSYLPQRTLRNQELPATLETSDEWISSRTGILSRHLADSDETVLDMALLASQKALETAGIVPRQIGLIVVATSTAPLRYPMTATLLQSRLGIGRTACSFDLQAACSGFVSALSVAEAWVRQHQTHALVVGSEVMSRVVDWQDRRTCVLFGDGAGAFVLGPSEEMGLMASSHQGEGDFESVLTLPTDGVLQMKGSTLFRFMVEVLPEFIRTFLTARQLSAADIDWVVPHQANERILAQVAERSGIAFEKVYRTIATHANTSAASVPLAFVDGVQKGLIQRGQRILLLGFGGGLTWGVVDLIY